MSKNGIKILLDCTFKVILFAIEVRKNLVFEDFWLGSGGKPFLPVSNTYSNGYYRSGLTQKISDRVWEAITFLPIGSKSRSEKNLSIYMSTLVLLYYLTLSNK
jgi:hypothetical protein